MTKNNFKRKRDFIISMPIAIISISFFKKIEVCILGNYRDGYFFLCRIIFCTDNFQNFQVKKKLHDNSGM